MKKYRPGKYRRDPGLRHDSLCLIDQLNLEWPYPPSSMPVPDPKLRLRTLADFEDAYLVNQSILNSPWAPGNSVGYHPGTRSWCFWKFQLGIEPPEEQVVELHKRHLLTRQERADLLEWVEAHPYRYSDEEKKIIRLNHKEVLDGR